MIIKKQIRSYIFVEADFYFENRTAVLLRKNSYTASIENYVFFYVFENRGK